MPVYFPDILENNNPQYPLMDGKFLKGTAYPLNQLSETGSTAMLNRKQLGTVVYVTSSQQYYGYYGQTTSSGDWDNPTNWRAFSTGSGGGGTGTVTGTGAGNYLSYWDTSTNLTSSILYQRSNEIKVTEAGNEQESSTNYLFSILSNSKNSLRVTYGESEVLKINGGVVFMPNLDSSAASMPRVIGYDSGNGKLFSIPTSSFGGGGGTGAGFPFSGSAVITGSLLVSGSGLTVTGSFNVNTIPTASYDLSTGSAASILHYDTNSGKIYRSNYKEYSVIFTVESAAVSIRRLLVDTIGVESFTTYDTGVYKVYKKDAFLDDRTAVTLSPGTTSDGISLRYRIFDKDTIYIYSNQLSVDGFGNVSWDAVDNVIENAVLDIKVYQ